MDHTLSSVLSQKAVRSVGRMSLRTLALRILVLWFAGLLSAAVISPTFAAGMILAVLAWKGYAIPKAVTVFALVLNARRIEKFLQSRRTPVETCEGLPVSELLDHLFQEKTFRRNDIEKKFRLPRYRVIELTRNLKRVGVLTTGINHMSILNPEFARQDVASILSGKKAAKDLCPLFRRDGPGFTSRPSAQEIAKRVQDLDPLPRSPGFISRVLAHDSRAALMQAGCYQGATA